MATQKHTELKTTLAIAGVSLLALIALRTSNPLPADVVQTDPRSVVYFGPAAATQMADGLTSETRARAEAALATAAYHGAYAEGPGDQRGIWTGAHTPALARSYALAACGGNCTIIAERVPLHDDGTLADNTLVALPDLAQRLSKRESGFASGSDILAIGGAGAWGTGHGSRRNAGWRGAVGDAVAECNARVAAEKTPEGIAPAPCNYSSLRNSEVDNRNPRPALYPAPYDIVLSDLIAVPTDETYLAQPDGTAIRASRGPRELYGVRATNGESADELLRAAGWPEAGIALAVAHCEAGRRFDEPPCVPRLIRLPDRAPPPGTMAVTPEVYEAYLWWQQTDGAGAFAIGALGDWEMAYGFDDLDFARQRAADRCIYKSRQGSRPYFLRLALIELPPCRIVAQRL